MPEYLVYLQPFTWPRPGVRIIGEITEQKVKILQEADFIFREEIAKTNLAETLSQYFADLTNLQSVGIKNVIRTYDYAIALWAIITTDFMSAKCAFLPFELLENVSQRIVNEVEGVNRVLIDYISKPPATIEFE